MRKISQINKIIAILLIFGILGCASYPQIKLDNFTQESFEIQENQHIFMLHISYIDDIYYFAMFDSLGVPLISRKLENGRFSNTKFLPPDSSYDELFFSIIKMIKQNKYKLELDNFKVKKIGENH